jgi:hypothetical protein
MSANYEEESEALAVLVLEDQEIDESDENIKSLSRAIALAIEAWLDDNAT